MNSTLIKSLRIAVITVLCLCMGLTFSACNSEAPKNLDEADQICVSGSYLESWMYVLTDEAFVTEMAEIFSDIDVEESEESVDMMTIDNVLSFTFSNGNDTISKVIVDSSNHLCYEAGGQAYVITSDFDFSYVKSLVDEQIDAVNASFNATSDEA